MYSVMWSEHCSYKSSKVHSRTSARTPPTRCARSCSSASARTPASSTSARAGRSPSRSSSHNHPSYVEPYQGAATGVGGIVRDIMSMGARPIAVMDPLRFGDLDHPDTQRVLPGVVAGIGGYGNCLGLPNIGGEVVFDDCYQGNPLVNALCVGVMRTRTSTWPRPPAPATRSSCSAPGPAATASAASRCSRPRRSTRTARPSAPRSRSATRSPRRCSSSAASSSMPLTSSTASRTSAAPACPAPPPSWPPTATAACTSSSTACRCATPRCGPRRS